MDPNTFDDGLVELYLHEVGAVAPLTKEQETELSRHVLARDKQALAAGNTLVAANLAMVVTIAQRYHRGNMHPLELVKRGNEGLLDALRTFSDHRGLSFSAQAALCVEAAIAEATAESERVVG